MIITTNNTDKDSIPLLSLNFDCNILEGKKIELNNIHLDPPLKNAANHLDDLRISSHKIEVEKLVDEQKWKLKRANYVDHLSFLTYVGMVTTGLLMIIFCYCCCCGKCCRKLCPTFSKWWNDNNPCTTIVFKSKTINSLHSSKESLKVPSSKASVRNKLAQKDAIDSTQLVALNKDYNYSGKR
jgi:hypothetical protein